jgi:hypothetical protein
MEQQHSPPGNSLSAQIELTRTNLSEEFRHTGKYQNREEIDRLRATVSALLSCGQFSVTFSAKGVDFGGSNATAVRVIYHSNVTPRTLGGKACFDMIMRVSLSFDVKCHYRDRGSRVLQIRVIDREMTSRDMLMLVEECANARARDSMHRDVPLVGGSIGFRVRCEERTKAHASLLSIYTEDGGTVTGEDAEKLLYATERMRYSDALVHMHDGSTRLFVDLFGRSVLSGSGSIGDISGIANLNDNPLRVFMKSTDRIRKPTSPIRQIATSDTKKMRTNEDDDDNDDDDDDDDDREEENPSSCKTAFLSDVALGLSNQPGKWEAIDRVSDFIEKAIECKSKDIAEVIRLAKERRDAQSRHAAAKEHREKANAALSQLRNKLQVALNLFYQQ